MPRKPHYAVLARVSPGYPPLLGKLLTCYAPVRRFTHLPKEVFSLDLHVLGTPPAFVLSQDQTLHMIVLLRRVGWFPNPILLFGTLTRRSRNHSGLHVRKIALSPHNGGKRHPPRAEMHSSHTHNYRFSNSKSAQKRADQMSVETANIPNIRRRARVNSRPGSPRHPGPAAPRPLRAQNASRARDSVHEG